MWTQTGSPQAAPAQSAWGHTGRTQALRAEAGSAPTRRAESAWCRAALVVWLAAGLAGALAGCGGQSSGVQAPLPPEAFQAPNGEKPPAAPPKASPASVAHWIAEGEQMADQLAEAFPDQPHALDLAARFHQRAGDPRKAAPLWQRCLALEPRSAYACFCLGSAAWERGDFEEAVGYLRKALTLDPTLPNAPVVLAEALMQLGRPAEALSALEKAEGASSQSMRRFLMGQACLQLGRFEEARQHLEQAVALEPQFGKAHYALVTAYMRLGNPAKAEEHRALFLKQLREGAGQPSPARLMGRDIEADEVRRLLAELAAGGAGCYALAGHAELARKWLARAMELDPQNPACLRAAEALRSAGFAPAPAAEP